MEQTGQVTKTCGGNCLQCSFQQRVYCASQISHDAFIALQEYSRNIQQMNELLTQISNKMSEQSGNNGLINPLKDSVNDILAQ